MTYTVVVSAPAEADLFAIYDYIAERAGGAIALRFVESIEAYCLGFAHMPERGHQARRSGAGITHRWLPPPHGAAGSNSRRLLCGEEPGEGDGGNGLMANFDRPCLFCGDK